MCNLVKNSGGGGRDSSFQTGGPLAKGAMFLRSKGGGPLARGSIGMGGQVVATQVAPQTRCRNNHVTCLPRMTPHNTGGAGLSFVIGTFQRGVPKFWAKNSLFPSMACRGWRAGGGGGVKLPLLYRKWCLCRQNWASHYHIHVPHMAKPMEHRSVGSKQYMEVWLHVPM